MKKRKRKQRIKKWIKTILLVAVALLILVFLILNWLKNEITVLEYALLIFGIWWAAVEIKRTDRE